METFGFSGTVSGVSSVVNKTNKRWRKEKIPTELTHSRLGLLTLYEPPQPRVDIVFVHGLQGDATRTWATSKVFWPRDLLPQDCPEARILTFGYSALVQEEAPLLIRDLGKSLLGSLSINRRLTEAATRPLIFVAHSLGGIVVKSALVYSRALFTVDEDSYQISKATCACVFFGTPHVKSGKASWVQLKSQISRALAAHSPSMNRIFTSMLASAEAEDMLRLSSDFCHQSGRIQLVSCIEMRATSTNRGKLLVAPRENAVMDMPNEYIIAIDADHLEMTKFVNRMDRGYIQIIQHITRNPLSKVDILEQFTAPKMKDERSAGTESIEGRGHITHEEDGADPVERERRFLSSLRSDWLDDVMIEDNSPGTCEWVLSSPEFQTWLSGSEMTLWIQGKGGAGKTVLAKFLYRQLCGVFAANTVKSGARRPHWVLDVSRNPRQVFAYFLDVNSPLRNSGLSVLQSLLHQILSANQELFRYIRGKTVFSRPERSDFGQYAEVLSAILRDSSLRGTIIVLDALDECWPSGDRIIDMLSNLANRSIIQLLVTSRPDERFKPRFILNLSESVDHVVFDIKQYVETAVRQLAVERDLSEEIRDTITRTILSHSSEGFLWVQLVLQRISKARTARMIRNTLEALPLNLHDAYLYLLGSNGSPDVNVRRTLYFVMVAGTPLRIKDLSALLALSHCWDSPQVHTEHWYNSHIKIEDWDSPHIYTEERLEKQLTDDGITLNLEDIIENQTMNFENDFRQHFRPLLSLNETSVSLVHYSLRDFLNIQSEIDKFHDTFNFRKLEDGSGSDLRQVHGTMAALCLQYMLAAFRGHSDPLDFKAYACFHWTDHARKAEGSRSFPLEVLVRLLFSKETNYVSSWLSTVAENRATQAALLPSNADVAFVLTAFDLGSYFGKMLDVSVESLQSTDQQGRTSLHLAAANNSLKSAQWIQNALSAASHDIGDLATMKDVKGESPISLAAQYGHEKFMERLLLSLKTKADFESRLFQNIADSGNIRMFKTLYDHTNIETLDQGMSLLIHAAALNSVDLLKRIVSDYSRPKTEQISFADLDVSSGHPLLHVALRRQASQVVKYLLDRRFPLTVKDENGNTALHIAAQEGNEPVVEKLIVAGVSVNFMNKDGATALHIASKAGLPAIVRALCIGGANVNLAESSGFLPAHLAASTGQEEIINILLDSGTNINITDGVGRSALHIAAGAGQAPTVTALLTNGADVNTLDDEGRNPVHFAVESGNLSILYMLCEAGADLSALDYWHVAPLHLAAKRDSEIIVRELIGLGADPNVRDKDGRTPLHYSCLSKRSTVAVIKTMVERGANVQAHDHRRIFPIHLAAEQWLDAIVRELALFGADLNCEDSHGQTPLDYAMKEEDNIVIIKVLRELGATKSAKNNWDSLAESRHRVLERIGFNALDYADGVGAKDMIFWND